MMPKNISSPLALAALLFTDSLIMATPMPTVAPTPTPEGGEVLFDNWIIGMAPARQQ